MIRREAEANLFAARTLLEKWSSVDAPDDSSALSEAEIEIADDTNAEEMLAYFHGKLSSEQISLIERLAIHSADFREGLVLSGEIAVGRLEQAVDEAITWRQVCLPFDNEASSVVESGTPTLELDLPNRRMMAADSEEVRFEKSICDHLELEVFQDGDRLVFDVSSGRAEWDGTLIGFQLRTSSQTIAGFIMLRLGSSGLVSGSLDIPRDDLVGEVSVRHAFVEASDLDSSDVPALLAAVSGDRNDPTAVAAWKRWSLNIRRSDDATGLAFLLDNIEGALNSFS
jgi:hypothetical protein